MCRATAYMCRSPRASTIARNVQARAHAAGEKKVGAGADQVSPNHLVNSRAPVSAADVARLSLLVTQDSCRKKLERTPTVAARQTSREKPALS